MTSTMEIADHYATLTADVPATTAARAALEQRIKELEADAARYRFLRDETADVEIGVYTDAWNDHKRNWLSGEDMDKHVDRAMSEAALQKLVDISQEYKLP